MPGAIASWASPYICGLATTTGRIEFVILRTGCSLPAALHPFFRKRSYFQLIGSDQPMQGLPPCRSNTLTGAQMSSLPGLEATLCRPSETECPSLAQVSVVPRGTASSLPAARAAGCVPSSFVSPARVGVKGRAGYANRSRLAKTMQFAALQKRSCH